MTIPNIPIAFPVPVLRADCEQAAADLLKANDVQYAGVITPQPDPILGHTFQWPAQAARIFQAQSREGAAWPKL